MKLKNLIVAKGIEAYGIYKTHLITSIFKSGDKSQYQKLSTRVSTLHFV